MKIGILSANPKLYSTRRLLEAVKQHGHNGRIINHSKVFMSMEKGATALYYHGERLENYDAVIPRIGASVTFFGAAVVRQFESQKVYSLNESQAIVRSRDKLRSTQLLAKGGIAVPKTAFAKFPKDEDVVKLVKAVGGAPVIIKLLEGTQGLGVVLAETTKAAKSVIEAFSGLQANILVQEFIKEAGGADIRVFVVGDEVVGAMKRQGKEGEFRSNLHRGGTSTAIKLKPREKSAAVKAAKVLGLRVAGVDLLQSKRGPLILEVNSSPGLEGIEKATGVDVASKIISYIEANAKKRGATADKIKI